MTDKVLSFIKCDPDDSDNYEYNICTGEKHLGYIEYFQNEWIFEPAHYWKEITKYNFKQVLEFMNEVEKIRNLRTKKMSKKEINRHISRKCKEPGCMNYCKTGFIICEHHLYGFPKRLPGEVIVYLKQKQGDNK
jgi:hypothetical protein